MSLPKECDNNDLARAAWISAVHSQVQQLRLTLPAGTTIRGFFRTPPNGQWSNHLQPSAVFHVRSGKIHEAKGREFEAVCVVIPPNRNPANLSDALVEAWERKNDTEAKRVIYVGVTRARCLCSLALPEAIAERCIAILAAGNVPFETKRV